MGILEEVLGSLNITRGSFLGFCRSNAWNVCSLLSNPTARRSFQAVACAGFSLLGISADASLWRPPDGQPYINSCLSRLSQTSGLPPQPSGRNCDTLISYQPFKS